MFVLVTSVVCSCSHTEPWSRSWLSPPAIASSLPPPPPPIHLASPLQSTPKVKSPSSYSVVFVSEIPGRKYVKKQRILASASTHRAPSRNEIQI